MLTYRRYQSYVKACITERAVPDNIDPEHVLFFHDMTGYCICVAVQGVLWKWIMKNTTILQRGPWPLRAVITVIFRSHLIQRICTQYLSVTE